MPAAPFVALLFVGRVPSLSPPVATIPPPLIVTPAALLMRSVLATPVTASSKVPPEFTVIPLVFTSLGVVVLLLSSLSVPALIVVTPV